MVVGSAILLSRCMDVRMSARTMYVSGCVECGILHCLFQVELVPSYGYRPALLEADRATAHCWYGASGAVVSDPTALSLRRAAYSPGGFAGCWFRAVIPPSTVAAWLLGWLPAAASPAASGRLCFSAPHCTKHDNRR